MFFSANRRWLFLIFESRIALASAYAEMDYIRLISSHHARPVMRKRPHWRMFR